MASNAGSQRATGSRSWKRPSSYSIISATDAIGLVIEAMRKMASCVIGALPATRSPNAEKWTTLPRRATSETMPATSRRSTYACSAVSRRASRADDIPTSSGAAVGTPSMTGRSDSANPAGSSAAPASRMPRPSAAVLVVRMRSLLSVSFCPPAS